MRVWMSAFVTSSVREATYAKIVLLQAGICPEVTPKG